MERKGTVKTNVSDLDFDCRFCFIFAKYSREIYLINLTYLILSRECKISVQIKRYSFVMDHLYRLYLPLWSHTHTYTQNYKITIRHHINRYQLLFLLFSAFFFYIFSASGFIPACIDKRIFSFNITSTSVLLLHNVFHLIVIHLMAHYCMLFPCASDVVASWNHQ